MNRGSKGSKNRTSEKKLAAAEAALSYLGSEQIIGVGTGSTTNLFIEALARSGKKLEGAVASSKATEEKLSKEGIELLSLNDLKRGERLPLYIDGADEATPRLELIKGGGGALTREKIVAAASDCFICVVDDSKEVETLGAFGLPIEVIPMARRSLMDQLEELYGGEARFRHGFITDNGNEIIDLQGLEIREPRSMEEKINQLPGVVTCGLFARRPADRLIVARDDGVEVYRPK